FTLTKALVPEARVTEQTPVTVTVNGHSTKTAPQTAVNGARNSPDTRVKKKLVLISPHLRPAASFLSD
ncbi:hypothetical protein H0H92_002199, partial [Tricholoma furcatifolium]